MKLTIALLPFLTIVAGCATLSEEDQELLSAYVAGCEMGKANSKKARTPEQADRTRAKCLEEAERYLFGDDE